MQKSPARLCYCKRRNSGEKVTLITLNRLCWINQWVDRKLTLDTENQNNLILLPWEKPHKDTQGVITIAEILV